VDKLQRKQPEFLFSSFPQNFLLAHVNSIVCLNQVYFLSFHPDRKKSHWPIPIVIRFRRFISFLFFFRNEIKKEEKTSRTVFVRRRSTMNITDGLYSF